jgi:hypothetical protein
MTKPARNLADQLAAVLAHYTRQDHEPEPLVSNFVTTPANDNRTTVKSEGLSGELYLKVTPSIEAIMRAARGEWVRNEDGMIVAIGSLRFSDGTQTEKAYMRGPDGDVIQYDRRMPCGSMLGTSEQLTEPMGSGSVSVKISNSDFTERFGVPSRTYIPSGKRRRGRSYTALESRAMLDAAYANTKALPEITTCPSGIASGTSAYSDQFIGMKIGSTGKGGAASWVDVFTSVEDHKAWREAHDALSAKDKTVLSRAMNAKTLADISPGGTVRGASKRGKRLLLAANDNYAANLRNTGT